MFFVSVALTIASIVILSIWWLQFGVDFKGGSVLEVQFKNSVPATEAITKTVLSVTGTANVETSSTGTNGAIIRLNTVDEKTHAAILSAITTAYGDVTELRFDSIGPTIGIELRNRSITAILLLLLTIIVYISIVFRKMSRVLSPWVMGVAAVLALIHDLLIPMGVFAILGHFMHIEISAVFVAAALTILGYSVSDTVVVFDRVRENVLRFGLKQTFPDVVHMSVMQTLSRSINSTLTTLLALIAIFFFGGPTLKYFALALIIGIFSGAYSSIFVAQPILAWWHRKRGFERR